MAVVLAQDDRVDTRLLRPLHPVFFGLLLRYVLADGGQVKHRIARLEGDDHLSQHQLLIVFVVHVAGEAETGAQHYDGRQGCGRRLEHLGQEGLLAISSRRQF